MFEGVFLGSNTERLREIEKYSTLEETKHKKHVWEDNTTLERAIHYHLTEEYRRYLRGVKIPEEDYVGVSYHNKLVKWLGKPNRESMYSSLRTQNFNADKHIRMLTFLHDTNYLNSLSEEELEYLTDGVLHCIQKGINGEEDTGELNKLTLVKGTKLGDLNEELPVGREYESIFNPFDDYVLAYGEDSFRYELDYYGTEYKKQTYLSSIIQSLVANTLFPTFGLVVFGIVLFNVNREVSPVVMGSVIGAIALGVGLGIISGIRDAKANNLKVANINDLKEKYNLYKDFYLSRHCLKESKSSLLLTDIKDNGMSRLIDFLNSPYKLEDGMPIRLHELIYLDNGSIRISHDIYPLEESEEHKELLLNKELDEKELLNKYRSLLSKNEKEMGYLELTKELEKKKESEERYQKALDYAKDYQELYNKNKNKIGENQESEEWETRIQQIEDDKLKYSEENKRILSKL